MTQFPSQTRSTTNDPTGDPATHRDAANLIGRRRLLKAAGAGAAVFAVAHATGDFSLLQAAAARGQLPPAPRLSATEGEHTVFNNDPFDPDVVTAPGGWFPSIYGAGDEVGALNEVTPQKTLAALKLIKNNKNKPPKTYNLGELMQEGMPPSGHGNTSRQESAATRTPSPEATTRSSGWKRRSKRPIRSRPRSTGCPTSASTTATTTDSPRRSSRLGTSPA